MTSRHQMPHFYLAISAATREKTLQNGSKNEVSTCHIKRLLIGKIAIILKSTYFVQTVNTFLF